MSLQNEADALLQGAVAGGDVPGVVAVATGRDGTIYEGGFGERVLGSGIAMTSDTVGWNASMTFSGRFLVNRHPGANPT